VFRHLCTLWNHLSILKETGKCWIPSFKYLNLCSRMIWLDCKCCRFSFHWFCWVNGGYQFGYLCHPYGASSNRIIFVIKRWRVCNVLCRERDWGPMTCLTVSPAAVVLVNFSWRPQDSFGLWFNMWQVPVIRNVTYISSARQRDAFWWKRICGQQKHFRFYETANKHASVTIEECHRC
jgi:hypothetical protein